MQKSITGKALSLLLALVMAMTMSVTAFAAATITPTPSAAIDLNTEVGTAAVTGEYTANDFEVTVTLTVDDEVTGLAIDFDQSADHDKFNLGAIGSDTVATGGNTTFTVTPDGDLDDTSSADGDGEYTATILVTCDQSINESITVTFTVDAAAGGSGGPVASSDKTLSALTYSVAGGAPVSVPVSASTTYNVTLPYGTAATAAVTLNPTPTDNGASVSANNGVTLAGGSGQATFTVTAADASTESYTVNFTTSSTPTPPTPPTTPTTPTPPPTGSSSSGSSGSGGSSGGGSNYTPAPVKSANVSADGSVNATTVTNELKQALNAAPATGTAVVTVKNAESISASAIQSLAKAASAAGKAAVVHADTVGADGTIQGRLYIDPAKLAGMSGSLKLSVATQGARPESRRMLFEKHFNNKVAVISFGQQGGFGARLKVAAKVTLPAKGESLNFYSYDAATNTFKKIDTAYRIDSNGFIHFETELAGDIIIADKPLAKK